MKKYFLNFGLMGAIALVGLVGFSACSDDKDDPDASGNVVSQNVENAPEVSVDFVFNVSTGTDANTRMTAANTQASIDQAFRGIDNAAIMSFVQKTGSTLNDGKWIAAATTADKYYNMGDIMRAGTIDPDATTGTTPKSRRVIELAVPTETNTIMFWGKAIKDGTDSQQGKVDWVMDKNLSNISFTLSKRIPDGDGGANAFNQYRNLIATVLTKIVQTKHSTVKFTRDVSGGDTESYTPYIMVEGTPTLATTEKPFELKWSDYVDVTSGIMTPKEKDPVKVNDPNLSTKPDLSPLGAILANAFVSLNTITANEVRAGSGPSVGRTLGDLYVVIDKVANATVTSIEEYAAKQLATDIRTGINSVLSDATNGKWKESPSDIKTYSGLTTGTDLVTGNINNFPVTLFHVPEGATVLKFDTSTFTYTYDDAIPTYAMSGAVGGTFNPLNYRYPAEICYFGNSPVRVTDDTHLTTDYPDGTNAWNSDDSWVAGATGASSKAWTKDGHVLSTTRSVAMQQNINYGTALLKTTVRYGAATLKDNNAAIQLAKGKTESDQSIDVTSAGVFELTGVLIGGVEPEVGWNYIAKYVAGTGEGAYTPKYDAFVYDDNIPSSAIPAFTGTAANDMTAPVYTMTWDNYNPTIAFNDKQNVVYVALEFKNQSGKDFWGMNGLIRTGATFYISGKLDPDKDYSGDTNGSQTNIPTPLDTADRSAGITWPTNYALPPYNADGTTIKQRRIFIQDYMTTANFIMGQNSLKSALVAVPDLRSAQLSLGLSVDLSWSAGLSFDGVVLGN